MRGKSYYRCFCILLVYLLTAVAVDVAVAQKTAPQFAPGVLTTIEPDVASDDTVVVHDLVELTSDEQLERQPATNTKSRTLYEMARDVPFRRDIWCLELAFKPLRMLEVDVPQPAGKMQRKLIWYMVYRVRNTGVGLAPTEQPDGTYVTTDKTTDSVRFFPQFVLSSQDRNREGEKIRKQYLDRIIPTAVQAIQRRELPDGELLNSVQLSEQLLQAETGRSIGGFWGVATWEEVDPKIDFFSVYVGGLTNAYDWQDLEDFQAGDPAGTGRKFVRKQLQLNFWRPGDAYAEDEREIRFGSAPGKGDFYGSSEGVAFQWIYR
ncbi:MAG: hypothetical protein AAGD11_03765 [Planctomycetota bacterium]